MPWTSKPGSQPQNMSWTGEIFSPGQPSPKPAASPARQAPPGASEAFLAFLDGPAQDPGQGKIGITDNPLLIAAVIAAVVVLLLLMA